jgi:hypothetical protein
VSRFRVLLYVAPHRRQKKPQPTPLVRSLVQSLPHNQNQRASSSKVSDFRCLSARVHSCKTTMNNLKCDTVQTSNHPLARDDPKSLSSRFHSLSGQAMRSICASAPQASTLDGLKKVLAHRPDLKAPPTSPKATTTFAEGAQKTPHHLTHTRLPCHQFASSEPEIVIHGTAMADARPTVAILPICSAIPDARPPFCIPTSSEVKPLRGTTLCLPVHDLRQFFNPLNELLRGRKKLRKFLWQGIGECVGGYANGLSHVLQCKLNHRSLFTLTNNNTDAWVFVRFAIEHIQSRKIKVHFSCIIGFKTIYFQVNCYQTL